MTHGRTGQKHTPATLWGIKIVLKIQKSIQETTSQGHTIQASIVSN